MSGYCDTCGLRPVAGVTIVRMGRTALYVHHCAECNPSSCEDVDNKAA
jgi:hypothetical protein